MATSTQIEINEPEHVYLNTTTEIPATELSIRSGPSVNRAALIRTCIVALFGGLLAVIQLAIGRKYADQCPVSPRIPHYLVVAGTIGLVLLVLQLLQIVFSLITLKQIASDKVGSALGFAIPTACSSCVSLFLYAFLFIWFILGCIWVFSVWGAVQYTNPHQGTYCHHTLYRFAFTILLISLIVKIFGCISSTAESGTAVKQIKAKQQETA